MTKDESVTRLQTALAIVVSLAATSSHSAHAGGDPPANSLDGKSFEGDGVWTRKKGSANWLYDFLLPETLTFVFEQK